MMTERERKSTDAVDRAFEDEYVADNPCLTPETIAAIRAANVACAAHGAHPHGGATCLDCPICRPAGVERHEFAGRCPTCGARQPSEHPAVSGGGEVTSLCGDAFHTP